MIRRVFASVFLAAWLSCSCLGQTGIITTVAGADPIGDGGMATRARLDNPCAIAFDASGSLYIADKVNSRIRKITPAGIITSVAVTFDSDSLGGGSATLLPFGRPSGIAFDSTGNLYLTDEPYYRVRKITPAGVISTVAGNGMPSFGSATGDGGPATAATIKGASGLAFDTSGNLYIAEFGDNRIRRVTPAGIITTVAGNGTLGLGSNGDAGDGGTATAAQISQPRSIALDESGNLFIAAGFGRSRVRKVTPAGTISTVAGGGTSELGDGGPATAARLFPLGITLDGSGNLYVVEPDRIRKVTPNGIISTIAGKFATFGFSGDGGPAIAASLDNRSGNQTFPGITFDSSGNLYFADTNNQRLRKVTPGGTISTVAGGGISGLGDGGSAISADLYRPNDVAFDSSGNMYIADSGNNRVRRVTPAGVISTVAGNGIYGSSGDGGPATAAEIYPISLATDPAGNLFIATVDAVRKVTPAGIISTLARINTSSSSLGLTIDLFGNVYLGGGNTHRVYKITPSGTVTILAGLGSVGYSGDGGPAISAHLNNPLGLAFDAAGNLYFVESGNHIIRKVTPDGLVSTVAGDGSSGLAGDGGPATSAKLGNPQDIVIDDAGNLYFSEFDRIRRVSQSGIIDAVAGGGPDDISDGSLGTAIKFGFFLGGIGRDAAGNVYVADTTNHRIRKITFISPDRFLLTGLSPGSVTEGEPSFGLTVRGANFQAGDSIVWNGSLRATTFVSSTRLTAFISTSDVLNPGTAQVTVSRGSQVSNVFLFSVAANNALPVISQVLPATGSVLGNTRLTILGDNFRPSLASVSSSSSSLKNIKHQEATAEGVYLGGKKLSEVIFVNRKRLEATTMPNVAASVDLEVVQSTGSSRLSGAFAYTAFPSVPPVEGTGPNKRWFIPFVIDSEDFRTNLGINNLSDTTATVDVLLVDSNGSLIAQMPATVPAHGMKQINHVMRELEKSGTTTGRQGYLILQSAQNIRGWASQVDNFSDDPGMELGRAESEAAGQLLLPSSVASSRFLTSLAVINSSDSPGSVTIRARGAEGSALGVVSRSILGKGYLFFQDFYQSLGLSDVFGPIEVETAGGIRVLAAERIYSRESTSGYFEGVPLAIASQMTVLPYSVDTEEFRTNLGVNNPGDTVATVTVSLVDKEGLSLGSRTVSVPPHGLTQLSDVNRQLLGSATRTNREGTLWLAADRPIIAWTSQIDNLTQDPSLVVAKNNAASKLLIPSTTSAGSFKSSLAVVNLSSDSNVVQVIARDNDGNLRGTTTLSLPPHGLMTSEDILASLGLAGTFGPLEIISMDNKPLLAVSRVYSAKRTGGYFEGLPIGAGSVP